MLQVKRVSCRSKAVNVFDNPRPKRDYSDQQFQSRFGQRILDMRDDLCKIVADHQPVPLQVAQCACQHPPGNAMYSPADLRMAQLPVHTKRVNNAKRPTVAGMRQHLSPHPVVIVPQAIANRLGILEDVVPA